MSTSWEINLLAESSISAIISIIFALSNVPSVLESKLGPFITFPYLMFYYKFY